jgi:hypothetical protein
LHEESVAKNVLCRIKINRTNVENIKIGIVSQFLNPNKDS